MRIYSQNQEKSVVKLLFSLEVGKLSQSQIESWAPAKIPIRGIDLRVGNMTQRWKDALDFAQMQNKKRKSVAG